MKIAPASGAKKTDGTQTNMFTDENTLSKTLGLNAL
jgi:hypothetical protein